jgi:hypothetical protein
MPVVKAYLFTNGVVIAFDRDGKQVPEDSETAPGFSGLVVEGMDWAADFQNKPELWLEIPNFFGLDWGGQ